MLTADELRASLEMAANKFDHIGRTFGARECRRIARDAAEAARKLLYQGQCAHCGDDIDLRQFANPEVDTLRWCEDCARFLDELADPRAE